jgi:hypothetical protein
MWRYNNLTDFAVPTDAVGFIYEIRRTNLIDDITKPYLYIGKKQLFGKGKFNKGTESDWRGYWGSSDYVKADIEEFGYENFERHILMFCYSYSELNWEELRMQMELGVLAYNEFSPMHKKYYNYNVIQKLYKDRYFDPSDEDRLDTYIGQDTYRNYPLYLTDGQRSLKVERGLYDVPQCLRDYPTYHIGSTPDTEILDIGMADDGWSYHYEKDEDANSIYNAFGTHRIINNGKQQLLTEATIPGYEPGALKPVPVVYEEVILAINIDTYETENVPTSKFKDGPYVKVGTRPIEVKVGKEIIFKGYAKKFVAESGFELKETWITRVLKKARTNSWQDLTPTYTKKAKELNPEIKVKKLLKMA